MSYKVIILDEAKKFIASVKKTRRNSNSPNALIYLFRDLMERPRKGRGAPKLLERIKYYEMWSRNVAVNTRLIYTIDECGHEVIVHFTSDKEVPETK